MIRIFRTGFLTLLIVATVSTTVAKAQLGPRSDRRIYFRSPGPGIAQWLTAAYNGIGLTRVEILTTSSKSDNYQNWVRRWSSDNGKTWSALQEIPDVIRDTPDGGIVTYPSPSFFDKYSGRTYRFTMRRQWPGAKPFTFNWGGKTSNPDDSHVFVDHVFVSENDGPDRLFRYEDPGDFHPNRPFDSAFINYNNAYAGNGPAFSPDGTVFFPIAFTISKRSGGNSIRRGVCLMRRDPNSGTWKSSNLVSIAPELSSRSLLEPDIVRLRNGKLLIVCRGSNTPSTPGRKWMIASSDSGKTLSPVEEFRYTNGSQFYSPSSIHRFVRSSRNGKLYWLANIVDSPPKGNSPRYPLCLAEIDEEKMAVIKESVLVIDDRHAGEPEALQLSNFGVLENRETLDIEIYVTLLGLDPDDFWHADVYRYIFSPPAR